MKEDLKQQQIKGQLMLSEAEDAANYDVDAPDFCGSEPKTFPPLDMNNEESSDDE